MDGRITAKDEEGDDEEEEKQDEDEEDEGEKDADEYGHSTISGANRRVHIRSSCSRGRCKTNENQQMRRQPQRLKRRRRRKRKRRRGPQLRTMMMTAIGVWREDYDAYKKKHSGVSCVCSIPVRFSLPLLLSSFFLCLFIRHMLAFCVCLVNVISFHCPSSLFFLSSSRPAVVVIVVVISVVVAAVCGAVGAGAGSVIVGIAVVVRGCRGESCRRRC